MARPTTLKALVDAAHGRGLMVFLDVVYNHFGPDGNYLHAYAPQLLQRRHAHAVGRGDRLRASRAVRDFFIAQRALLAGGIPLRRAALRRRARHRRRHASRTFWTSWRADRARARVGAGRHVHLVLENDGNTARHLERDADGAPRLFDAQWNDDFHHVAARAADRRGRRLLRRLRRTRRPTQLAPLPRRGLRLSGRAVAASRRRAARRAERRTCRRPPSCSSCRTTTRSATAPSATASRDLRRPRRARGR